MKSFLRIFAFLLAFALLGAPVGMARMMGGHAASSSAHQHHQQAPQKSAPHMRFMVCAACVGVAAFANALPARPPQIKSIVSAEIAAPDGITRMPLLPPPRG